MDPETRTMVRLSINGLCSSSIYKNAFPADPSQSDNEPSKHSKQMSSIEKTEETPMFPKKMHPPVLKEHPPSIGSSDGEDSNDEFGDITNKGDRSESLQLASSSKFGSKGALHSPIGSTHSFDLQVFNHF